MLPATPWQGQGQRRGDHTRATGPQDTASPGIATEARACLTHTATPHGTGKLKGPNSRDDHCHAMRPRHGAILVATWDQRGLGSEGKAGTQASAPLRDGSATLLMRQIIAGQRPAKGAPARTRRERGLATAPCSLTSQD
ncbi:protein of unknown function [Rhodovastum atsumiense]|nr:protein of unknown function [Rhodovastum atsumiense]